MQRIIQGVSYDTETASVVARYKWTMNTGEAVATEIHRTRGGVLFQVSRWTETRQDAFGNWGEHDGVAFEPLTRDALDTLVAETDGLEMVDSNIPEDPPEATAESAKEVARVDDAAAKETRSTKSWVMRCMERCLRA